MNALILLVLTVATTATVYGQRMVINEGIAPEGQVTLTTDGRYTIFYSGTGITSITAFDNNTGEVAGSFFMDSSSLKFDVRDRITAVLVLTKGLLRVVDLTTGRVTATLAGVSNGCIDELTDAVIVCREDFTLALHSYPSLELRETLGDKRYSQAVYPAVMRLLLGGIAIHQPYYIPGYYYVHHVPDSGWVSSLYVYITGQYAVEQNVSPNTCTVIDLRNNTRVRTFATEHFSVMSPMALSEDGSTFAYVGGTDQLVIARDSAVGTMSARFFSKLLFPASSADTIHVQLADTAEPTLCAIEVAGDSLILKPLAHFPTAAVLPGGQGVRWYSRGTGVLQIRTADSTVVTSIGANFSPYITPDVSFSGRELWMPNVREFRKQIIWQRYPLTGETLQSDLRIVENDDQWFVPRRDAMYERTGVQLTLRHIVTHSTLEKYDITGIPESDFEKDAHPDVRVHAPASGSVTLITPGGHAYWASSATSGWQRLPLGDAAEHRFVDWDTTADLVLLQPAPASGGPTRYLVCDTRTGGLRAEILPASDSGKSISAILSGHSQDLVVMTGRYVLLYALDSQAIRFRRIFPETVLDAQVLPDGLRLLIHWGTITKVHSSVVAISNLRLEVTADAYLQPLGRDTTWIDLGTHMPERDIEFRPATLLTSKNPTRTPFEPRVWQVMGTFDDGWSVVLHCGERIVIYRCPVGGTPVITHDPYDLGSSSTLPNLATDQIHAFVTGPPLSEIVVTMSDLRGRSMSSWTFPVNSAGIAELDVSLAGFAAGLYAFIGLRPPMEPFTFTVMTP